MEARDRAATLATQREGRCTCAMMDGGVDCPWCEVFYAVLQGHPLPSSRSVDLDARPPSVGYRLA